MYDGVNLSIERDTSRYFANLKKKRGQDQFLRS